MVEDLMSLLLTCALLKGTIPLAGIEEFLTYALCEENMVVQF